MKRILQMVTATVLLIAAFSPAQAVVIGAADAENSIPFGSSNSGANFVYQQVYNSSNFSSAFDITSITFYDTFGNKGGVLRDGAFRIFLSTTSAAIGAPLGIPPLASLTEVYNAPLPTLANGRLDFDNLTQPFHYDPSQGQNLLLTILAFGTTESLTNPLRLDFMSIAGSLMSWGVAAGPGMSNKGLVTGFNDDVLATPLPAALPLFATILAGGGLIAWRRKRKAAKVAA
jgi:hypothetical protein